MSRKVISTNLRFNMADPDEKRALEYLQGLDRRQYKSYTKAVALAVNAYFGRLEQLEADPYLETRQKEDAFLQKITEAVTTGAREAMPDAITSLLAGLFQQKADANHDCTALNTDEGLQEKAKDASMTGMNADVDAALDFADGF